MYVKRDKEHIVVKLEKNEDLVEKLTQLAQEENIKAGMIVSGIGMLRDPEIGYYTGTGYEQKKP